MAKYSVSLTSSVLVEVEADSPHKAVSVAEAKADRGWRATAVETDADDAGFCGDFQVVAKCEGCSKPILDGDDYRMDDDGIYLCEVCQLNS